jgi:hypothetical protein
MYATCTAGDMCCAFALQRARERGRKKGSGSKSALKATSGGQAQPQGAAVNVDANQASAGCHNKTGLASMHVTAGLGAVTQWRLVAEQQSHDDSGGNGDLEATELRQPVSLHYCQQLFPGNPCSTPRTVAATCACRAKTSPQRHSRSGGA